MQYWKMRDRKMQEQKCRGGKCRTEKCMTWKMRDLDYSTVGVSLRLPHRAVSSALPCSLNRAAAGGQLVTSSAASRYSSRGGVRGDRQALPRIECRRLERTSYTQCRQSSLTIRVVADTTRIVSVRSRRRHCTLGTAPVAPHIPHRGRITCLNAHQTIALTYT